MKDRKVVKTVLLLKNKEKRECIKWLHFEFNNSRECEQLFNILWKDYVTPSNNNNIRTEEEIWEIIYPDKAYSDGSFRKLCNKLASALENLLAYKSLKSRKYDYQLQILYELRTRKDYSLAGSILRKSEKMLANESFRDQAFYFYQSQFIKERATLENSLEAGISKKTLDEVKLNLDAWFLHAKMYQEHFINNYSYRYKDLKPSLLDESTQNALMNIDLARFPVLEFYTQLYAKYEESPQEVEKLIPTLWTLKPQITSEEYINLYIIVCNYFARKANSKGAAGYLKILLGLYEWGIKEKIIGVDLKTSLPYYRAMFKISIRLGLIEKYNKYLSSLKELLEEDEPERYQLLLGQKMFYEEQFAESAKILGLIALKSPRDELDRRNLRLQARYDLGERQDLETEIRSLKEYVRTQKEISGYYQKSWYNRIKLFERLIRVQTKSNLEKLKRDIQVTEPLGNRDWLLTKVDEALQNFR